MSSRAPYPGELERIRFDQACRDTIANTADRLGVDPVAFAEACQDGEFLTDAVECAARWIEEYDRNLTLKPWEDKLAALKRAEQDGEEEPQP